MPRTDSPADLCRIVLLVFLLALYVSACGEDTHTDPERRDVTPPGSVTNLFAQRVAGDSVLLRWSAPGDDEHEGRASRYQIRYHEDYITEASWVLAIMRKRSFLDWRRPHFPAFPLRTLCAASAASRSL